jgi:hypothetical protein
MKRSILKLTFLTLTLATGASLAPGARATEVCQFTGTQAFCQDNVKTSIICIQGLEPITIQAPCNLGSTCRAIGGLLFCCYQTPLGEVCAQ